MNTKEFRTAYSRYRFINWAWSRYFTEKRRHRGCLTLKLKEIQALQEQLNNQYPNVDFGKIHQYGRTFRNKLGTRLTNDTWDGKYTYQWHNLFYVMGPMDDRSKSENKRLGEYVIQTRVSEVCLSLRDKRARDLKTGELESQYHLFAASDSKNKSIGREFLDDKLRAMEMIGFMLATTALGNISFQADRKMVNGYTMRRPYNIHMTGFRRVDNIAEAKQRGGQPLFAALTGERF